MYKTGFVLLVLLIAFGCGENRTEKINKASAELKAVSAKINADFVKIREQTSTLATQITEMYENQDELVKIEDKSKYKVSENGVYHKMKDDGGAAVFVSNLLPLTKSTKKVVWFTAPLDPLLKQILSDYDEVAQAYYNDKNNYNRIYPFIDVLTQYEPKINLADFNFYYLADGKHNPERKALWINDPYVDPAGRGWMVSAIAPVYYKGELMGVPGIDVTINTIIERYLSQQNSDILIIDENGVLVAAEESSVNKLYLPPLKNHKYIETIKGTKYRKDDYNLLKSKNNSVREMASQLLKENKNVADYNIDGVNHLVVSEPIAEINWKVLKIVK